MQHIILVHTNKKIIFKQFVCVASDFGCPRSTIPTRSAMHSSVPLWPFLVSIHGVAFTMADETMYCILNFIEVTQTIHIIVVTLLHVVHLVTEVLLLPSPLPHLLCGYVRYIVRPIIQRPL
jgi:hypothetical protein